MAWISTSDKLPPRGLEVLLEVSGNISAPYSLIADHAFYIGSLIKNTEEDGQQWLIYDSCDEENYHLIYPKVHAWMPLPRHYEPPENFKTEEDLLEHAMFEKDPDYLYKGDAVYEQITIEEVLNGQV